MSDLEKVRSEAYIHILESERDALIKEKRFVEEVADSRLIEISKLKGELETMTNNSLKNMNDSLAWKSRAAKYKEALDRIIELAKRRVLLTMDENDDSAYQRITEEGIREEKA